MYKVISGSHIFIRSEHAFQVELGVLQWWRNRLNRLLEHIVKGVTHLGNSSCGAVFMPEGFMFTQTHECVGSNFERKSNWL